MSESSPAASEVKIRLKHRDWEVEITCSEEKVKQVVENVLSGIDTGSAFIEPLNTQLAGIQKEIDQIKLKINSSPVLQTPKVTITDADLRKASSKGGATCRGLLETLWFEGYFGEEKPLGEVHEELSRRGYNYDRTAVSHSLTDMVRESILTRVGTMRNYRYIQKRPPNDIPI